MKKFFVGFLMFVAGSALAAGIVTFDGLATVNFPAASAGNARGVLYDTTLGVLKYSDGTGWNLIGIPANAFLNLAVQGIAIPAATNIGLAIPTKAATLTNLAFTTQNPGVGAGNFQIDLCNGPAGCAVSFGNILVACAAAQGVITTGTVTTAAIPANTNVNWRMTANACTANANAAGDATANVTTP